MPVFFVPPANFLPDKVLITGSDVKHITRVLRHTRGDRIKVCDENGNRYLAKIEIIDKGQITASLEEGTLAEYERESLKPPKIIIGQSIPKGYKMDLIIQKASELGASELVPLLTRRTIFRHNTKVTGPKTARWQKIAQESAKQSGSREILHVGDMKGLVEFCKEQTKADLKLILWEEERLRNLRDVIAGKTFLQTIALIIGPEGGFTPQEIEQAHDYGFLPTSLGPRVLRVETVALALLTILQYQYGDLG